MIARELRLRREVEFERVRSRGATRTSRLIAMKVLPNALERNRYGFAAGRRIGNAVQRNRAKRLMREAVRPLHVALLPGYDFVFIARNSFSDATTLSSVAEQMCELLHRSGLMQDPDGCDDPFSG